MPMSDTKAKRKRWIVTYNSLYVMCMDISEQAVFPGDKENVFFFSD